MRWRLGTGLALVMLVATACAGAAGEAALVAGATTSVATTTTTVAVTTTATIATATTTTTRAAEPATAATPAAVAAGAGRRVHQQAWSPFATAGGVVLRHPASRVELIGFHQSTLDGAQELTTLASSAPTAVLEDRERDTGVRTAADVVVDPDAEIRAPVTGTVLYSGTYVLYCEYSDDFLVIEPDDHPGWEVKMLHIDGVQVRPGMRVQAAQTVVAPRATRLPFPSQVDKFTADPAWPHVHVEIDDPNVPDRPTGPGCP
ncbi:MAG: hypothetical protein ACRD12_18405 [Acidimicrobiales bacterium]